MCGIAGMITQSGDVVPFLVNALKTLKTRGYDGFGIAVAGAELVKDGYQSIDAIIAKIKEDQLSGATGIAHSRWATHGAPIAKNAHPHQQGPILVVHNGDIDNYDVLKGELIEKGFEFKSDTDTEVFAALVSWYRTQKEQLFFDAVQSALDRLGSTSTYAFVVMDESTPGMLIAARRGSSLLWSTEGGNTYVASQEAAFYGFVSKYQELADGEVAVFTAGKLEQITTAGADVKIKKMVYEIDPEHYQEPKKTSEHLMYQEMMDARNVIERAIGKRASKEYGIALGGLEKPEIQNRLLEIDRFIIAGCGTSYHAAILLADALQEIAGIAAEAMIASEAIYKTTVFNPKTTAVVVISQSGETADVVKLMTTWKKTGVLMLGIVNVPNTQIPRLTDAGIYCHIGREDAVASTKAFIGQVICSVLFTLWMAQQRGKLSEGMKEQYIDALLKLPEQATQVLLQEHKAKKLAGQVIASAGNVLFMGRKQNAVVAFEGALKVKEITFNEAGDGVHAIGIAAGEMKHGTIAMVNEKCPVVVIIPKDSVYTATMNNFKEVQARSAPIIVVTTEGIILPKIDMKHTFVIPQTLELLSPVLSVIPLQMISFFAAICRGCNPDMPKNLAKSVTVE